MENRKRRDKQKRGFLFEIGLTTIKSVGGRSRKIGRKEERRRKNRSKGNNIPG